MSIYLSLSLYIYIYIFVCNLCNSYIYIYIYICDNSTGCIYTRGAPTAGAAPGSSGTSQSFCRVSVGLR